MTAKLTESASLAPAGKGWLIQLMSEGVGSSGTYPADVLERDGAAAFPAGTHIYLDHLTESEEWDRAGSHSIKDLVGVTTTPAQYDPETKSLRAESKWFNGYESFIEQAHEHIGLSIEVFALANEAGVVESFIPSPLNAVAVVPRAGRDGKFLSLMESFRSEHAILEHHDNGKESAVTPEDIQKIVEALTPLIEGLKESLEPAVVEPVVEDEDAVDASVVSEALIEAELPKGARAKVYEAVKNGAKIEDAIAAEKAYLDELRESLKSDEPAAGRVKESATADESFVVRGW
jgi:hypothetical protein